MIQCLCWLIGFICCSSISVVGQATYSYQYQGQKYGVEVNRRVVHLIFDSPQTEANVRAIFGKAGIDSIKNLNPFLPGIYFRIFFSDPQMLDSITIPHSVFRGYGYRVPWNKMGMIGYGNVFSVSLRPGVSSLALQRECELRNYQIIRTDNFDRMYYVIRTNDDVIDAGILSANTIFETGLVTAVYPHMFGGYFDIEKQFLLPEKPASFVAPNPCDKSVSVTFMLNESLEVSGSIINSDGQVMKSGYISPVLHPPGRYTVSFDCEDWVPGIYFCRLDIGKVQLGHRVVVYHK